MIVLLLCFFFFFFQAEDGIRDDLVTGVQTCALPISPRMKAVLDEISHSPGQSVAPQAPKNSPSVAPPTSAPRPACVLRTQRESTLAAGIVVAGPALRMVTKLSELKRTSPSTNASPLVRMRTC